MTSRVVAGPGRRIGPAKAGSVSPPNRFDRVFAPWWVFAPVVGAAIGILMAVRLFVPGPIGLADNGDGPRLMCALDVVSHAAPGAGGWEFVVFDYVHAGPGKCDPATLYPSSGTWLLGVAHPLSRWLGFPGELDLRALAVLVCVIVGLAFAGFAAALRGRPTVRAVICLLLFVVVGDVAFAGYAASPYSELAGLLGILVATVGATHLGGSATARVCGLAAFTAGAVLAVASKVQSMTMVLPFTALLLVTRVPIGRFAGAIAGRILPLLAAAVIAGAGMVTLQAQTDDLTVVNSTEVIFVNLLGKSSDPVTSAVELGLPREFAMYAGRSWWAPNPPEGDPRWPEVRDRMNFRNITGFLAHHPGIATRIWFGAMSDFGQAHPDYLGSYPVRAGLPPRAQEARLQLFSSALQEVGGGVALTVVLAMGVAGLKLFRGLRQNPPRRAFVAAMLCLVGVTAVQFVTSAYGEAVENTKHMVFGIFSAGLVLVLAAAAAYCTPGTPGIPGDPGAADGELPSPREADGSPDRTTTAPDVR